MPHVFTDAYEERQVVGLCRAAPQGEVHAAERDTSVSALVAELLTQLVGRVGDDEQMWAEDERLMESGLGMRVGAITWSREDVHAR